VSLFCRHSRLTANCPICSRELQAELKSKAPPAPARARPASTGSRSGSAAKRSGARSGVVTRRVARAPDDGYRNALAPGLRATADAERLAGALVQAAARLEPPGPYPEIADADHEQGTWLAFLLALAGPDAPELQRALIAARPRFEDGVPEDLPEGRRRSAEAYLAWTQRAGSQDAAFSGDASWTPERRFARVFERLALPGFGRAPRYDLLTALGAAGLYDLVAAELQLVEDDATTLAAKRLLVSGDRLLLERRARELAEACELPIAALDRGLAIWNTPGAPVDLTAEPPAAIRAALSLR
jgi:hypothetical protein